MSEIEKKWYVLRAVSGKENKVKEYIEADMRIGDFGQQRRYIKSVTVRKL